LTTCRGIHTTNPKSGQPEPRAVYETVRLPEAVHVRRTAKAFSDRPPPTSAGAASGSPGSRAESFHACVRVFDSAASCSGSRVPSLLILPSPHKHKVGTPIEVISELDGWPACAPVNASPAMLPPPAHDSGSGWVASPFLYGSFIRNSPPVYPGAFAYPLPPFTTPPTTA